MKEQQIQLQAMDGYQLAATIREPETSIKGIVQIHCGTGIPQSLYANLACYLTENGYVTLTFDYRGIAKSAPADLKEHNAKISDWGKLDMTSVLDWVVKRYPSYPKTIVAHSMGGQLIGLMENHSQIDKIFMIASSTGYWRDMSSPYKWLPAFFWYFLIPIHTKLYGYVNAMKVRQGENLPKGVALEWRKWCTNSKYFEVDFGKSMHPLYYDDIKTPITAIHITDDPLANEVTANKLLRYYKNANIKIRKISPESLSEKKIGHTGFFSRKFKNTLWKDLLEELNEAVYVIPN
jgi:predicted alpha/beta hydrolase